MIAFLKQVAEHPVSPAMITSVCDLMADIRPRKRESFAKHFTRITAKMMRRAGGAYRQNDVAALYFRMQALCIAVSEGSIREWTRPSPDNDGSVMIAPSVFVAAALARLRLDGPEPSFDEEHFRSLVLDHAETEGRG